MLIVCLIFFDIQAFSLEISGGFSAVSEGDDRHRPAANLAFGFGGRHFTKFTSWGRSSKYIKESSHSLAYGYRFAIFSSKRLAAHLGACLLNEKTTIEPQADPDGDGLTTSKQNLGFYSGLSYGWEGKHLVHRFFWDHQTYPAGSSAILLTTARKHYLGLESGIVF